MSLTQCYTLTQSYVQSFTLDNDFRGDPKVLNVLMYLFESLSAPDQAKFRAWIKCQLGLDKLKYFQAYSFIGGFLMPLAGSLVRGSESTAPALFLALLGVIAGLSLALKSKAPELLNKFTHRQTLLNPYLVINQKLDLKLLPVSTGGVARHYLRKHKNYIHANFIKGGVVLSPRKAQSPP